MTKDSYCIDSHKLLWHLDRVLEWSKKRVIAPIYVEVSPVSFCNHKCTFCGIDFAQNKGVQLETEILSKRLAEMGKIGVKSMMFAGEGEPLLHKGLPKFVKIAKENGIDVSLTTNGSVGSFDLWSELLPHLTWIRFSVDAGSPEVYASIHKVTEESFSKTLNSIKDAVRNKKENALDVTIGVQYLIIEENLKDIENALTLFSDLEVDYFSLKPYSLHPQMIRKKNVIYTKKTMDHIEKLLAQYEGKTGMNIIFRKDAMEKYMNGEKDIDHCRALPFWGYISSKGDFYTCSVFIGDERFRSGNIYNDNMEKIIFGNARKKSIEFGEDALKIEDECRLNCRMARANEFLELLDNKPDHINFV